MIEHCHVGTVLVFTDPRTGQKYYGGGYSCDFHRVEDSVLVALDEIVLDRTIIGNLESCACDTIFIKWDDYSIPQMFIHNWGSLLLSLRETKKNVSVACIGGHGRTGTALAILGYLSGAIKDKPIEYVRSVYCNQAVESYQQIEYIGYITGVHENVDIPKMGIFCELCGNKIKGKRATFKGNAYCTKCVKIISSCARCGAHIDGTDPMYVIKGRTYCAVCEDWKNENAD